MRVLRVLRNSAALLLAPVVLVIAYLYVPDMNEGTGLQQYSIPLEDKNAELDEGGTSGSGSTGDNLSGDSFPSEEGGDTNNYFLTYDEILNIENISLGDKLAGLSIIRKIPGQDLNRIMDMADGGITLDEAGELEVILEQKLDSNDIDKLKEIVDRSRKLYVQGNLADK
jgi:hypothetical protein